MLMPRKEQLSEGVSLYLGDCLEILPSLPKVDAVVTDPPYGIDYVHSGKGAPPIGRKVGAAKRHGSEYARLKGDDKLFDPTPFLGLAPDVLMWGANNFAHALPPAAGRWLIWDKADGRYEVDSFGDAEIAWHSRGKANRIFAYAWKGVYCVKSGENNGIREHPTMKPIGLMAWCIRQCANPRLILDPFMGSGTTGVAAVKLGRQFIGIEIEPKYFDVACRRITQALKEPDMFAKPPQVAKQEAML